MSASLQQACIKPAIGAHSWVFHFWSKFWRVSRLVSFLHDCIIISSEWKRLSGRFYDIKRKLRVIPNVSHILRDIHTFSRKHFQYWVIRVILLFKYLKKKILFSFLYCTWMKLFLYIYIYFCVIWIWIFIKFCLSNIILRNNILKSSNQKTYSYSIFLINNEQFNYFRLIETSFITNDAIKFMIYLYILLYKSYQNSLDSRIEKIIWWFIYMLKNYIWEIDSFVKNLNRIKWNYYWYLIFRLITKLERKFNGHSGIKVSHEPFTLR